MVNGACSNLVRQNEQCASCAVLLGMVRAALSVSVCAVPSACRIVFVVTVTFCPFRMTVPDKVNQTGLNLSCNTV